MARTALTPIAPPADWGTVPTALTFTALDGTDGGQFTSTGRELVIVRNTNATARTVTVPSTASARLGGRAGASSDQTASLAQNDHRVFGPFPLDGWVQTDGRVYINVTGAGVEAAVIRLRG